jgi:hypothetical protein
MNITCKTCRKPQFFNPGISHFNQARGFDMNSILNGAVDLGGKQAFSVLLNFASVVLPVNLAERTGQMCFARFSMKNVLNFGTFSKESCKLFKWDS